MCGKTNDFGQTIQAIGNTIIPIEQRMEKLAKGGGFNFNLPGGLGGFEMTDATQITSSRGNQYLRRLLINGASANLLRSKATNADPWVIGLRRRRPSMVVAVALANKTARIAWAVMHRQENYQRTALAA